jgi:multidrug resistance protein, MATE family
MNDLESLAFHSRESNQGAVEKKQWCVAYFDNEFRDISKSLSTIALPLAFDYFVSGVSTLLKELILTNMSGDYLRASILIFPIELLVVFSFEWSYSALQVFFLEAFQEGNKDRLNTVFIQSYVLSFLACLGMVPLLLGLKDILQASGMDEEVANVSGDYFRFLAIGFPAELIIQVQRQFLMSTENETLIVPIKLYQTFLDFLFIYLFVFFLKLPGSTVALAISAEKWLAVVSVGLYINLSKKFESTIKQVPLIIDKELLCGIGAQQLPILLTAFIQLSSFLIYNVLLSVVSSSAAQAFQTSSEITDWILNPAFAIGYGVSGVMTPMRKQKNTRQQKLLEVGVFWSQVLPGLSFCLTVFLARYVANALLYNENEDSEQAVDAMVWILPVRVFMVAVDSLIQIAEGALRGFEENKYTSYSALGGTFLFGLPLALVSAFYLQSVTCVLCSMIAGSMMTLGANSFFYQKKCRPLPSLEANLLGAEQTSSEVTSALHPYWNDRCQSEPYVAPLVNFANVEGGRLELWPT